jgi:hypothetical protein
MSMNQLAVMQFESSPVTLKWIDEWKLEFAEKKKKWDEYNKLNAIREEEWRKWDLEEQEILQSNKVVVDEFKANPNKKIEEKDSEEDPGKKSLMSKLKSFF